MDPKLSYSLAKFTFTFCNELDKNKTTVCSPLSAEMLLAMTAVSCKGWSRAELMQALDISDDQTLHSSFSHVTSSVRSVRGVTLNMANKVFLKKGSDLKPGIKKLTKKVFKSGLKQIDFNEKEDSARKINKWVAKKTNGLIKNIISADNLNKKTRLVLVSAIYFKGKWRIPFLPRETRNREFHVNNKTVIEVPTMYKEDVHFKYGVLIKLRARLLEMEYKRNGASMVFVLPDEIEGLSSVLRQLAGGYDLVADVKALTQTEIDVMIPKFKVEMTIDLKELLPKLGIKSILDEFSSEIDMLTSGERLMVSEAIQKAYIVVDETGTEAAATTTVIMRRASCGRFRPPSQRFIADRPFLYLLMVRGILLFAGVYEGSQFAVSSRLLPDG